MKGSSDWLHTETWPLVFFAKKVQLMHINLLPGNKWPCLNVTCDLQLLLVTLNLKIAPVRKCFVLYLLIIKKFNY